MGLKDGATGVAIVIGSIVGIGAIGAGIWAVDVATSNVHGRGNQIKQVNSNVNRTQWYIHFYDQKTAYESQVAAVKLAKENLAQFNKDNPPGTPDPTNAISQTRAEDETNLTGAKQQCVSTATAYNNDTLKTRVGAQFKDSGLPETLDATACNG